MSQPEDAQELERAFQADRRKGIGGSDVAAILGLDPRKTPYQLWREKVGVPDAQPTGAALRRGKFMESAILDRYAATINLTALERNIPHQAEGGWRRGNQDARATGVDGVRRVVEAKSLSRHVWKNDWGTPWSDEVPDRALCQGLWYSSLDDVDVIDFAVLVMPDDPDEVLGLSATEVAAVSEFHVYQCPRDRAFEEVIAHEAREFWHRNVLQRIEPELVPLTDDVSIRWPLHIDGETKPVEPVIEYVLRLEEAREIEDLAKKVGTEMRDRILIYAEAAEALIAPQPDGVSPWVTMKQQKLGANGSGRVVRYTKWWNRAKSLHQIATPKPVGTTP